MSDRKYIVTEDLEYFRIWSIDDDEAPNDAVLVYHFLSQYRGLKLGRWRAINSISNNKLG